MGPAHSRHSWAWFKQPVPISQLRSPVQKPSHLPTRGIATARPSHTSLDFHFSTWHRTKQKLLRSLSQNQIRVFLLHTNPSPDCRASLIVSHQHQQVLYLHFFLKKKKNFLFVFYFIFFLFNLSVLQFWIFFLCFGWRLSYICVFWSESFCGEWWRKSSLSCSKPRKKRRTLLPLTAELRLKRNDALTLWSNSRIFRSPTRFSFPLRCSLFLDNFFVWFS